MHRAADLSSKTENPRPHFRGVTPRHRNALGTHATGKLRYQSPGRRLGRGRIPCVGGAVNPRENPNIRPPPPSKIEAQFPRRERGARARRYCSLLRAAVLADLDIAGLRRRLDAAPTRVSGNEAPRSRDGGSLRLFSALGSSLLPGVCSLLRVSVAVVGYLLDAFVWYVF